MCLFRTERSTDQVIKPVNLEALSKWVGAIPEDVRKDITSIAPMLERLGYDPHGYPPNYGEAEKFVADNTRHIKNNEDYWRRKGQEILSMSKPPRNYGVPAKNIVPNTNLNPENYGKDKVGIDTVQDAGHEPLDDINGNR